MSREKDIATMDRLSTNRAVAAETPKSDWIKGSDGRKICIANGPSAVAATKVTIHRKKTKKAPLPSRERGLVAGARCE